MPCSYAQIWTGPLGHNIGRVVVADGIQFLIFHYDFFGFEVSGLFMFLLGICTLLVQL